MKSHLPFGIKESAPGRIAPKVRIAEGRVELLKQLGVNWMGMLWRGLDLQHPESLLVTFIRPEQSWQEFAQSPFFFKAALSVLKPYSGFTHPLIQSIVTVGAYGPETYFVHTPPKKWGRITPKSGTISASKFVIVGTGMARAVDALHSAGLVHGGLNPDEFALEPDGTVSIRRLGYLTLRRMLQREGQLDFEHPQLDAFVAPEDLMEEPAEPPTDIFSMGVIGYQLLTGKHPFKTASGELDQQGILTRKPSTPTSIDRQIPDALSALIMKMISKDPDLRPSPREIVTALQGITKSSRKPVSVNMQPSSDFDMRRRMDSHRAVSTATEQNEILLTAGSPADYGDRRLNELLHHACRHARVENYIEALRVYATLLEQHPTVQDIWLGAAWCLYGLERWEELDLHLREGMHEFPRNTDLQAVRVMAMCETGQRNEAVIRAAQILDPEEPSEWPWLAHAYAAAQNDPAAAMKSYQQAVQHRPKDWRMHYLIGRAFFDTGNFKEAAPLLNRAYPMARSFLAIPYLLGQIALISENPEKARRYFERCLEIDPDCIEAQEALAEVRQAEEKGTPLKNLFTRGKS